MSYTSSTSKNQNPLSIYVRAFFRTTPDSMIFIVRLDCIVVVSSGAMPSKCRSVAHKSPGVHASETGRCPCSSVSPKAIWLAKPPPATNAHCVQAAIHLHILPSKHPSLRKDPTRRESNRNVTQSSLPLEIALNCWLSDRHRIDRNSYHLYHEEHAQMLQWRGKHDPTQFDCEKTTKRMRRGLPNCRKFKQQGYDES